MIGLLLGLLLGESALVALGVVLNSGVYWFIFAILNVIMVHEAGHFAVAKLFGFKATKFFLGFGPTIWSVRRGETEYGVKAIPAGGFVKIIGMTPYEEIAPEDQPRSYPNKPRWQRALLLIAGSATHWVMAFLMLLVTAMAIGFPTGEATNELAIVDTRIQDEETPAAEIGLRPGDRIVAVNGRATESWAAVRAAIRANAGEEATFTIERDGTVRDATTRLGTALFDADQALQAYYPPSRDPDTLPAPPKGADYAGFLGVQPDRVYEKENFFGAVREAGTWTGYVTVGSAQGIGEVATMVFGGELWDALTGDGERDFEEAPLGLVGAGRIAGATVARGDFLRFIGLIVGFTVFVGLMNLLPLPPLDGGHLAVLAYEKVTGRTVDVRKLIPLAAAVISFFMILFLAVLYLDVARPVKVPF